LLSMEMLLELIQPSVEGVVDRSIAQLWMHLYASYLREQVMERISTNRKAWFREIVCV